MFWKSLGCLALVLALHGPARAADATPILVVDVAAGQVLYAEEAGRPWFPASTTKLMTAFVTFEAIRAGRVSMQTPVVLSTHAMSQKFLDSGLHVGSTMTMEDALFAMISGSTNDIAMAIAETVAGSEEAFVKAMNDAARRLGMTGSRFTNPNGLFDRRQKATARDMALLGIAIDREFPQYRHFFETSAVVIDGKTVESHNELLTRFDGARGLKTGYLCAAGNNVVALAERGGRQVMVVVMGATTERERNERAAMYLTQAFAGELSPGNKALSALTNDTKRGPPDMRAKQCGEQTRDYERMRDAAYPMGLPGQISYLAQAEAAKKVHQITTWLTPSAPKPEKTSTTVKPKRG
ncbi:D-alanyl-D-alanine carboxypeptidase family protein [Labrys sp. La1]|uniref:D-alanyl-D-alanine carboxypeptidase family protein n=1 Tax=Labrys sp. La1 TaxID=3404917 RepID=UPI003EBE4CE5